MANESRASNPAKQILFYLALIAVWAGGLSYFKGSVLAVIVWTGLIVGWIGYDVRREFHLRKSHVPVPNRPRIISRVQANIETVLYVALIGFGWFWGLVAIYWGGGADIPGINLAPWMILGMIVWTVLIRRWVRREVGRVWRDYDRGQQVQQPDVMTEDSEAELTQGKRQGP